ncbi:hypothetical protein JMJ77_0003049 [Colletotrichum scovillei]|uniref:Uncharacterized protein n=1 Tax=Colletotrichum scovillei TaxID=1209932 RepID=A0A9P7QUD1_9PEZI|nr:hypothetical protein JMJ78_0006263 [Colletotrichum scovillei]KAG7043343.1 hypothetical protein JMJ77_0003049 [Colletotrichum scovillei]KAG7062790.1 hypothetical protein JMJ76_0009633 [Colletotrichum scovillei]
MARSSRRVYHRAGSLGLRAPIHHRWSVIFNKCCNAQYLDRLVDLFSCFNLSQYFR